MPQSPRDISECGDEHISTDEAVEIMRAVRDLEKDMSRRGVCLHCTIAVIIYAAATRARDLGKWPLDDVIQMVSHAFDNDDGEGIHLDDGTTHEVGVPIPHPKELSDRPLGKGAKSKEGVG
jgi:hypothetical protein